MELHVKKSSGKIITLHVLESDTVKDIKAVIQLLQHDQNDNDDDGEKDLSYRASSSSSLSTSENKEDALEDDLTLADYQIQEGSTLHLLPWDKVVLQ